MGIVDTLRSIFGTRTEIDAKRNADVDDLFGMSTAYITMETELGFSPLDVGALCFSKVDSTSFRDTVAEVEAILEAGRNETGTDFSVTADAHGYQWVVLETADPEDLITSIHFAADTFIERGYGSRLLAAVFGYQSEATNAYWIYSFRRGRYYPFVPESGTSRNRSIEFKLEAVVGNELSIEAEKEYWYPLWPSTAGKHPWQ